MIANNTGTLTVDLNKILNKSMTNASQIARAIAIELETRVVQKSPVDTGRLRGNWNVGINAPNMAEQGADISGMESNARALGALSNFKLGDSIFITNNLPYTHKLEFGLYGDGDKTVNGYSKQAPQGFIRITYQEVMSALENIGRKVVK
jgi:hypothetical protein